MHYNKLFHATDLCPYLQRVVTHARYSVFIELLQISYLAWGQALSLCGIVYEGYSQNLKSRQSAMAE